MTSSHLVLGAGGMLLAIGLVMVFSATSVMAVIRGQPVWATGATQVLFACIGLVAMFVALHLPTSLLRRWAGRAMLVVVAMLCLVLVPGVGLKLNGARQWFDLGFTNLQPSEIAKLVFALWGAHVLATRDSYLTIKSLLVPVLPVFGVFSVLLMLEPDFGAVVSLGLVVAGLLWAGGLPMRMWAGLIVAAGGAVVALVQVAPYRMARITSFLNPFADPTDGGYQAIQGFYALASGGLWGVGLGNSRAKWGLLPHAQSDYIFAIIGEELGFLGCLVVVALYGVLAFAGFRIARRSTDRFIQVASVAITVWLIGQATMNMGYVVGLLPVTGVQLPLISAGGTSLVLTLFIIGLLARFARSEPDAVAWGRSAPRSRLSRWLLPIPQSPVDSAPARRARPARPDTHPAGRRRPPAPREAEPRVPRAAAGGPTREARRRSVEGDGRTVTRARHPRPAARPAGPVRHPVHEAVVPREVRQRRDRHAGSMRSEPPRPPHPAARPWSTRAGGH